MGRKLLWGLMALSAAIVAAYALSSALVPSTAHRSCRG